MSRFLDYTRWFLLAVMIGISGSLMLGAAKTDSAIFDETAHIPAGYSYVRYFDYRLNPEHPPLVKALAGIPLLFQQPKFPTESTAWIDDVNGQWQIGNEFFYQQGNNPSAMIYAARLAPIALTLLTIVVIYYWSVSIIGRWWALLPTFLFAFSPTVLAHGHYVTTDIGATLGFLIAIASFCQFLMQPSRKGLLVAGIAFGIAQLLKFSALLLVPYLTLLMIIFYLASIWRDWSGTEPDARLKRFAVRAWRYFRSLFFIFAIGFALVYVLYFLLTLGYPIERQISDTKAIIGEGAIAWMAGNPIVRPVAEYLLGVTMVIRRAC